MALGERPEGEEERSLRDDLAASLKAIEEREASAQPASEPQDEGAKVAEAQPNAEAPEAKADRGDGRDAHGKFVAKPKEGQEEGSDQAAPVVSAQTKQAQPSEGASPANAEAEANLADAPPKSWRADEAQAWKDLPATAKSAILRREAEAARLAGANDAERMFGREMADIFRPHVQEIQAAGASPQQAVKVLLANHNALRSNDPNLKLAKARELMAAYGIDPTALAQPDPNAPPPHVLSLQQEIERLKQQIANPQGQQFAPLPPSAEEGNIMAEIEAFRADPAHPHFDAVGPIMGKLLETGAAPDLETAYHAAVAMDPALRSTVPAPQPQAAANPQQKTAAARQAAVSVTGSPGPTGNPRAMTLRDELREQMRSAGFSGV